MNSGVWEESWTGHLAKRKAPADAIDEFWRMFIDELIEVVTEDGVVDCRYPENIEAWVGPPWVTLKLGHVSRTIVARFWTQRKDMSAKHLFDKTLRFEEGKADLTEFGSPGFASASECGSIVAKFLFSLRKMEAE